MPRTANKKATPRSRRTRLSRRTRRTKHTRRRGGLNLRSANLYDGAPFHPVWSASVGAQKGGRRRRRRRGGDVTIINAEKNGIQSVSKFAGGENWTQDELPSTINITNEQIQIYFPRKSNNSQLSREYDTFTLVRENQDMITLSNSEFKKAVKPLTLHFTNPDEYTAEMFIKTCRQHNF